MNGGSADHELDALEAPDEPEDVEEPAEPEDDGGLGASAARSRAAASFGSSVWT